MFEVECKRFFCWGLLYNEEFVYDDLIDYGIDEYESVWRFFKIIES